MAKTPAPRWTVSDSHHRGLISAWRVGSDLSVNFSLSAADAALLMADLRHPVVSRPTAAFRGPVGAQLEGDRVGLNVACAGHDYSTYEPTAGSFYCLRISKAEASQLAAALEAHLQPTQAAA